MWATGACRVGPSLTFRHPPGAMAGKDRGRVGLVGDGANPVPGAAGKALARV